MQLNNLCKTQKSLCLPEHKVTTKYNKQLKFFVVCPCIIYLIQIMSTKFFDLFKKNLKVQFISLLFLSS